MAYLDVILVFSIFFSVYISDTLTLSVRDLDELQGYIVKHYKIHTQRMGNPVLEYYFITQTRMFRCLNDLVKHYSGMYQCNENKEYFLINTLEEDVTFKRIFELFKSFFDVSGIL